ncbi:glycoside hydrolase domain-containing protein [Streptomyces sp. BI20]|uniref:glycoside hydrolase domain-containing protein n=1 Tax=Streptomyces sp. BI20 TaxID=3403460 RepID=UPI003C751209
MPTRPPGPRRRPRHPLRPSRLLASACGAVLLLTGGAAWAGPTAVPRAPADGREVDYLGTTVTVPADWRVVDFARDPHACLRLDRPTLYLGTPGDQADCPARGAADRADTLHLEPAAEAAPRVDLPTLDRLAELTEDGDGPVAAALRAAREARRTLPGGRLLATVSYAETPDTVRRILERAVTDLDADAGAPGLARTATATPAAHPATPRTAGRPTGRPEPLDVEGFDACTAPTQDTMDAWRAHSPFRAVGVYIGGRARACAQPRLTADWIERQRAAGWHPMPIWVGPQPWANRATALAGEPAAAARQGLEAADGAAAAARALGLAPGSVLYLDVEHYQDRAAWDAPVLAYTAAWTERLHELGWASGVYAAANSGVRALAGHHERERAGTPDVLWSAAWNGRAETGDTAMGLPAGTPLWSGASRVHQYRGDHAATFGGARLTIDRNRVLVAPDGGPGEGPGGGPGGDPGGGPGDPGSPVPTLPLDLPGPTGYPFGLT